MALHLQILGRVQGVGYRAAMVEQARQLGLTGWVRNRRDGSVEAVVCGAADAQCALLAWARKGPSFAQVAEVSAGEIDATFVSFDFRPTE